MAKKTKKYDKKGPAEKPDTKDDSVALREKAALEKLPKDVQEKLKTIKTKLDKFQKRVLEKFDKYIVGMTLMPPPKQGDPKLSGMPPQSAEQNR